jgi:hypothetical protein
VKYSNPKQSIIVPTNLKEMVCFAKKYLDQPKIMSAIAESTSESVIVVLFVTVAV